MPLLSLQQISFFVFKSIQFDLSASECIGISGASGSGKSRLLRIIADLEPFAGDILLNNQSLHNFKPHVWRKHVGLLPAESQWWFDHVGEHFVEPNVDLLQKLGFEIDVMNWQVSRLSTGEKQRLALARLLYNQPQVLLLDEPTSNLDKRYVRIVEEILIDYKNEGAGLVWVSHDPEQLQRIADRCLRIQGNALVEKS